MFKKISFLGNYLFMVSVLWFCTSCNHNDFLENIPAIVSFPFFWPDFSLTFHSTKGKSRG